MNLQFWFLLIAVALTAGLAWGVSFRIVTAAASLLVIVLAFFPGGVLTGLALVPVFGAAWAYARSEEPVAKDQKPWLMPVLGGILALLWFAAVLPESALSFPMLPSDTGRAAPAFADFALELKDHPEGILLLFGMGGAVGAALWKGRKR